MPEYTDSSCEDQECTYDSIIIPVNTPADGITCIENDNTPPMYKYSGTEVFDENIVSDYLGNIIPTNVLSGEVVLDTINVNNCVNIVPANILSGEAVCLTNLGMYKATDKLAFLATVDSLNGQLLPELRMIVEGNNNSIVLRSDRNGVVCEYLPFDDYYNFIGISPNYIVYNLIEKQDMGRLVYKLVMQKVTKANATYRQLHRKFV